MFKSKANTLAHQRIYSTSDVDDEDKDEDDDGGGDD